MTNLGKLAREFERKVCETPSNEFVKVHLSRSCADRLSNVYLQGYEVRVDPINPHIPDFSTYVVAALGRNQND